MNAILCVIDVQPRFKLAAEYIIQEVVHQIKLAIKRKSPILLVEYGVDYPSYGEIYESFRRAKPHLRAIIKKIANDGSHDIIAKMKFKEFQFNRIRLCGVNTCACVKSTAKGLKQSGLFNRIEISTVTNCLGHGVYCFDDVK